MSQPAISTVANLRRFSPALFFVVLLCFLLPFVTISCDSAGTGGGRADLATLTGLDVIIGKNLTLSTIGSSQSGRIDWEPMALIAALAAVVGLAVTFVPKSIGAIGGAIAGVVAFMSLLSTKFSIDRRITQPANLTIPDGSGAGSSIPTGVTIVAVYQVGYWLALVLSAVAAGLFIYLIIAESRQPPVVAQTTYGSGSPTNYTPPG